ncbi:MAG: NACHT domain-containing protein [Hormoscilla sp. GM7CHS1pb]|nr:NACHT domain-containing protein [Hormoscilla sp. GM7CHS1pb]
MKIQPLPQLQKRIEAVSLRESYRHRQTLLNKVRNYWIRGVLEKISSPAISLSLAERLDAIEGPIGVGWETPEELREILPQGTKAIDLFDRLGEGRSLLILGEPGSGKTTTLLSMARDLLSRAQADMNHPIPVIFNLSSFWRREKKTFADWLVAELQGQYQVPEQIARSWIKSQELLLLLDGLDEVTYMPLCLQAIDRFSQEYGRTEMVVTTRLRDYEMLPQRLKLQGAIAIQPLTGEAVQEYLIRAEMSQLNTLLQSDKKLQELVTTPLMLQAIARAYEEMSVADLSALESDPRKHLFNAYIQRMFTRRQRVEQYDQSRSLQWLSGLALRMEQQSQTLLLIERMQPSWLRLDPKQKLTIPFWQFSGKEKTLAYKKYAFWVKAINGLIWGLISGIVGLVAGNPSIGIFGGLIGAASTKTEPIEATEALKWSWVNAKKWLPLGLICAVSGGLSGGLFWGVVLGMSGVLFSGLMSEKLETTTVPNEGIWQSLENAIVFAVTGGLLCLMGGAGLMGKVLLPQVLSLPIFTGGVVGLVLAMLKGGDACIKHFIQRLVLYSNGDIPWNYARFLDYGAERGLLKKVGGGYIFTHRLLQAHFADLAIENYLENLLVSPEEAEGYLQRAHARAAIAEDSQALEDYTQAIALNPDLAEAYGVGVWCATG